MPTLLSALDALAESFADSVLDVIRGSNVEELLGSGSSRRPSTAPSPRAPARPSVAPSKPGRLPRRSADDIAAVLGQVIALVKKNRDGLRAEQIRESLDLEAKELPRVLKEGLATRKLRTKGQKRATTYFAL